MDAVQEATHRSPEPGRDLAEQGSPMVNWPFPTCDSKCGVVHTDTCRLERLIKEYRLAQDEIRLLKEELEAAKEEVQRQTNRLKDWAPQRPLPPREAES